MAATLVCVVVFVIAGIWQIQRGQAKAEMLAQRSVARKGPAQPLMPALANGRAASTNELYGLDFQVSGRYDSAHQILLDNQVVNGRVGYRVWTPLVLDNGRRVLIDRGWVPLGPGGRGKPPDPPVPDGRVTVRGLFRSLPAPGIRLGGPPDCVSTVWPRVLNYPTIETVRCLYQEPVIKGVILLSEEAPNGFVRNWQTDVGGLPPMRHYGYALQWFAMAVAVVVILLVVTTKRTQ